MSNGQKKIKLEGQGNWLKKIRGKRTIKQMSEFLGVSERAYRHYEKEERKISGAVIKLLEIDQSTINDQTVIKQPEKDFDLHGGWKPHSLEDLTGIPEGSEFWRAFQMLASIYASKDPLLIKTIFSNLQAFSQTCEKAEHEKILEEKVSKLQFQLDEIEAQLNQKNIFIPERRSGIERRKDTDENWAPDKEQRNGIERRTTV